MERRGFLLGLGATLLCAPTIVRAASHVPATPITKLNLLFQGTPRDSEASPRTIRVMHGGKFIDRNRVI